MKNAYAISSLARQLIKVGAQIDALSMGIQDTEQNAPAVSDVYEDLLLDEVEHAQILTLQLTSLLELATEDGVGTNADEGEGSAFAAGDLTVEKGGDAGSKEAGGEEQK